MKQSGNKTGLSIIIVSYNVKALLLECLRSVLSTPGELGHEVIVIDNASADGSAEAVREAFPSVRVIANDKNLGFARANNQGFEASSGEFVLLLNPDTVARPGAISEVFDFMKETPDAGIAGCRLLNPDGSLQRSIYRFPSISGHLLQAAFLDRALTNRKADYFGPAPHRVDYCSGAFMMVRREAVGDMQLLNPDYFMYAEEKDLAMRLRENGWRAYFVPYGEVVHYGGMSTGTMPSEMFLELQRSQVKFFFGHHPGPRAWGLALSWALVLASNVLASIPLMAFGGGRRRLSLFMKAMLYYPSMVMSRGRNAP